MSPRPGWDDTRARPCGHFPGLQGPKRGPERGGHRAQRSVRVLGARRQGAEAAGLDSPSLDSPSPLPHGRCVPDPERAYLVQISELLKKKPQELNCVYFPPL